MTTYTLHKMHDDNAVKSSCVCIHARAGRKKMFIQYNNDDNNVRIPVMMSTIRKVLTIFK